MREKFEELKKNFWFFGKVYIFAFGIDDDTNGPGRFPVIATMMKSLKYTTKQINREFKIKVSGMYDGHKINTLVGVSGLIKMVDDIELTNRLLDRAFVTMDDKVCCKLRRGLRISFYVH